MSQMKCVVGFSGGADSQACALWCRQRFPPEDVILCNTQAGGNEHPLTLAFVQEYSASVFPVVIIPALIKDLGDVGTLPSATRDRRQTLDPEQELTFDLLAWAKGRFPSRKAQFCTEYLKLRPQRRWCVENLLDRGIAYERYIGVRRDESERRRNVPEKEWDDFFDTYVHRPLAAWTKQQVFDFLKEHGEEVNPLYRMGFNRVGCAPCINNNKDDVREWAARFPEMIDKVREWEARVGRTFFAPTVPAGPGDGRDAKGRKVAFVDEVVQWSKTARGGRMLELPFVEAEAADGSCVSKYGLCE